MVLSNEPLNISSLQNTKRDNNQKFLSANVSNNGSNDIGYSSHHGQNRVLLDMSDKGKSRMNHIQNVDPRRIQIF